MVVEAIMSVSCSRSHSSYFETSCVYDYFYEMNIACKPILDHLANLYSSIKNFMIHSYNFVKQLETEIRTQIQ